MFAYCQNNPVVFVDPSGEFLLTALIVGVVAGAVIGGAVGGTIAYNSAKTSGAEGMDLFWTTVGGVLKGALIGGGLGGLAAATGGTIVAYGPTSLATTAMITATTTILSNVVEVTALQARKSAIDGDNGWQTANDCMNAITKNSGKIALPALTKTGTTGAKYIATDIAKHKVVPLTGDAFLKSPCGKFLPYGIALLACGNAVRAFLCDDPYEVANQRGYYLE